MSKFGETTPGGGDLLKCSFCGKSQKQAVAIALSEARKSGAKIPKKSKKKRSRK